MKKKRRVKKIGIYKVTNKVNNKVYIGQSIDIESRFVTHKQRAFNENDEEYNKPLYNAIRKYGKENFEFEILEECKDQDLNDKEIYYIKLYQSTDYDKGYNIQDGGSFKSTEIGENHHNHSLTEREVIDIRTRYNNREDFNSIFNDYKNKISLSGFKKIFNGYSWTHVMMNVYTEENRNYHINRNLARKGTSNGNAKLTKNDISVIKNEINNGLNATQIYNKYFKGKVGKTCIYRQVRKIKENKQ